MEEGDDVYHDTNRSGRQQELWRCARGAWVRAVSNVGDGSVSENDVFIYKVMP